MQSEPKEQTALATRKMSDAQPDPVRRLAKYVVDSGLAPAPLPEEYRYASLPLCIIDVVFSIGVGYNTTAATVARFCERTGWPQLLPSRPGRGTGSHTIDQFLDLLGGATAEQVADRHFGNRQRTSTTSGILKAEAVRLFAAALAEAGIVSYVDLTPERVELAEAMILGLPGQGSGIAFDYFRMLAGNDDLIKPDRMVQRFVAGALCLRADPTPRQTALLVRLAAKDLRARGHAWSPLTLDHAIWRHQSGRDGSAAGAGNMR